MKPTKGGIILRVDPDQKERAMLGDVELMIGNKYKTNHRDKSPVVGIVEVGNDQIKTGSAIVCHHNFLYGENSVFALGGGLFSIPVNLNIFMRIDEQGEPHSMFGNIICERIWEETAFEVPDAHKKQYIDRARVINSGYGYKKGQTIFHTQYASYEIIYNWGKIERRVIKVLSEDITAILLK